MCCQNLGISRSLLHNWKKCDQLALGLQGQHQRQTFMIYVHKTKLSLVSEQRGTLKMHKHFSFENDGANHVMLLAVNGVHSSLHFGNNKTS